MRLEAFKQTRLCKFHVAGNCVRGNSCNFAHSIDQIRDQPDFSKTRLCAIICRPSGVGMGSIASSRMEEHELRPHPSIKNKEQKIKIQSEEKPVAWYTDEGCDACDGWYFMADGMDGVMYPWYPGYSFVEYPLVQDEYAWDTTSSRAQIGRSEWDLKQQ